VPLNAHGRTRPALGATKASTDSLFCAPQRQEDKATPAHQGQNKDKVNSHVAHLDDLLRHDGVRDAIRQDTAKPVGKASQAS
jgi:hypothetical protein